jgi:hypothetical protein
MRLPSRAGRSTLGASSLFREVAMPSPKYTVRLPETVLSMLTVVCHFKKVMHRVWAYFHARLAFTMAVFNVLVQWHGFQPNASGFVPLSIAEFSL